MDERLSRSNRLPGSEKLTRPEEIGQLSKYLKSIKEVYEESTRLEDQVLGVSGRSTGKIPVIDELGKKVIKAPENEGESIDLSRKILSVPDNGVKLERLRNKKIEVPDVKSEVNLENEKISRPGNENPEVTRLSEVIKKIEDVRKSSLSEKRVDIEDDQRDIALSDKRLDLQAMINASLRNKRIELGREVPETKLADKRIELKDESEVELEDKRISLSDNRENQLETKKIKISDEKEIKLEEKRLDIQDAGVNGLSNKRIDLSAEEDLELGDKKVKIYDERQTELEDKRVDINPESDLELSKKRLDIKDESNPKLEDTRINLFDDRNLELSEKRIDLKDEHEVGLRDKRLDLTDEREYWLGDKRIDLTDEREDRLEDKRLDLKDDRENRLEDKRLDLKDERENELEDKRLDLKDERENELEDKRLDLKDERENELEDKRLDLEDKRENKLEDKRLDLKDERENTLSDKILELLDNRENRLEDKRLDLKDDRENNLEDKRLDLKDERENSLSDKILSLDVDNPVELENKRLDLEDNREDKLEDKRIGILENENGEPEELYDQYIGMLNNENGEPKELYDALLQLPENENPDYPNIDNIESLKEYTAKLSDSELYEFAMKIANEGEMDGWLSKVESLMSAYLSSDILTPKRAIEFRDAINNTLEMSYFGSQAALRVPVDTSSGTTWAKAEEAIGEQITGTNRRDALDEMIVKMVDYKKVSLPGGNIIDTVKDNIPKNASDVISGSISHNYPVNAPIGLNGLAVPGGPGDAIYQAANNRTRKDSLDHVGDVIGNTFYSRYWSSKSFKTTLEDLCPIAGKAPVASLTELKAILKSSPYFTSPGKFMTDAKGSYNTMTLDTNMYWEVTIEPFCCDSGSCSNGGYSYLPDIREINYLNKEIHKVRTNYGRWAPINSFELQKSKLQTKSLQLFEGEIAYPSGMEFTNELRLTFVDDSWKSWKRYFERCAQASVFNTNEKKKDDYESEFNDSYITRIDKTNVCVASYKNVTFNIKIYILNPQLNLLNRFNLLCVLKDFSEEYVGDIDSGGTDLNVSFSIVGENPEEDSSKKFSLDKEVIASLGLQAVLETQKRATAAINCSVGLL